MDGDGATDLGGRPKELEEPVQITLKLEREQLQRLEAYAQAKKINRLKAIRQAIDLLVPQQEKKK